MNVIIDWKKLPNGSEKKHAYYASREWAVLKEQVRERACHKCERCGSYENLQVHHQTYIRFYRERLSDLLYVCEQCHLFISGKSHSDPAKARVDIERIISPAGTCSRIADSEPLVIKPELMTVAEPDYPTKPSEANLIDTLGNYYACKVAMCHKCRLSEWRNTTVFGTGSPVAKLFILGEAPGVDEDKQGEPFVGKSGKLLRRLLNEAGIDQDICYFSNVLKCRPPDNRTPSDDEINNCSEHLNFQLSTIQPSNILCLGIVAVQSILPNPPSIGKLRGKFYRYKQSRVTATYHPSYLLRNPDATRFVEEDLRRIAIDL